MKKLLVCFLLCAAVSMGISACGNPAGNEVETDREVMSEDTETKEEPTEDVTATPTEPEEIDGQEVVSSDGKYQVTAPEGWEASEKKQDDMMTIELQGPSDDQYAGIMVIDKASVGTMDIGAYMDSYATGAREQFEGASVGEKTLVDVNGKQAYYMAITGKVENVSYVNWVYAIDGIDSIYVATASAYPMNSAEAEAAFREIVFSFTSVVPQSQE